MAKPCPPKVTNQKWWHRQYKQGVLDYGQSKLQQTNYYDEFKEHPFNPVTSFKPNLSYAAPQNKMANDTTFSSSYYPHELQKHELPPKLPYLPPTTTMQTASMYTHDYPGRQGAPAMPIKPRYSRPSGAKFNAIPTYSHDYQPWGAKKPDRPGPLRQWNPPQTKMDIETTFKRDYPGKYQPVRESMKPPHARVGSDVPIESNTTQRHDFIAHQLERRTLKSPKPYQAPTVPMEALTTMTRSFNEKPRSVRESLKPPHPIPKADAPMAGDTVQKSDYIPHQLQKPHRHQQPAYQPPQGKMNLQTSSGVAYVEKKGLPATAIKPPNRPNQGGAFEGNTNYMKEFQPWGVVREKYEDKRAYVQNPAKFDGATTFNQTYKEHHGAGPSKSCKPVPTLLRTGAPIEGNTIYSTSYIPKSMCQVERYPTPEWIRRHEAAQAVA